MNIKKSILKDALLPKPATMTSALNDENIAQSFDVDLFNMDGITRNVKYPYATINNSGNIVLHTTVPVRMVDNTQTNANYRNRTVWLSVSRDSAQSKENKNIHYNSNLAMFEIFSSEHIKDITDGKRNPYNCITVSHARLRNLIVPYTITPEREEMDIILKPIRILAQQTKVISESELDDSEKTEQFKQAFNVYCDAIIKLVEEGLLMYTTGIITPEQSSINVSIKLEDSLKIKTNPWLNAYDFLRSPDVKMNQIPTINNFRGLIEIIEVEDNMEAILHSDNNQMLGRKELSRSGSSIRYALAKLAIIKDYNSDVNIVVSILDIMNGNRSRVEALESLLAKGQNTLLVDGVLSPVVRLINSESSRNGNIFFELKINRYSVHNTSNIRRSVGADDYSYLDGLETISVGDSESLHVKDDEQPVVEKEEQNQSNNSFDI